MKILRQLFIVFCNTSLNKDRISHIQGMVSSVMEDKMTNDIAEVLLQF